jgi:hypothetical protein
MLPAMAYPIEKEKQIQSDIRPGQSPEIKKQTDAFLEYQADSTNTEIEVAEAKAKAQTSTVDEFQWVESDTHKGFFEKQREWLKSSVWNGFEWLWSWVANAAGRALETDVSRSAKIATGVGIAGVVWYLGYKAWKRWKWDSEENKEKSNSDDKKESKEWILNSIWWSIRWLVKKVAFWGGWALAATYLASYLLKGTSLKELISKFLVRLWIKDPEIIPDPVTGINSSREKLQKENPERAAKATNIAQNINTCRWKTIFQNTDGRIENDMLWENWSRSDFIFDKAPWAIIANMDAEYESVSDMLSKNDYISNSAQNAVAKPINNIMEWSTDKINKLLKPLANMVEGIKSTFRGADGNLTEEGKIELAKQNPTRDEQLHNIFGKYMRVKLRYQVKEQQLREKFAKDALWSQATSDAIEDYLDNNENLKVIDARIKAGFLDKRIIDAEDFLLSQWIPNDKLPENMEEVITDINDEHKKYKSIEIQNILTNNEDPKNHKEGLTKSCNLFIQTLTEPAIKRNMCEGVLHAMGFDILANTQWSDIETIAKQMWFDDIVGGYTTEVNDIALRISNWTLNKEDIQHLNNLMESFRMLQIEITLWWLVKNESDGKWGVISKMTTRGLEWTMKYITNEDGSINNVVAWVMAIWWIVWWRYIFKNPKILLKWLMIPITLPMKLSPVRWLLNRIPQWERLRSRKYIRPEKADITTIAKYKNRFINDIKNSKLSLNDAKKIREKRLSGMQDGSTQSFEKYIEDNFHWKTYSQIEAELKAGHKITWTSSIDNLLWEQKNLVTKISEEIAKLEREKTIWAGKAGKWHMVTQVSNEIKALESFSAKVSTLTEKEAASLIKATEKISIKTLAILTGRSKDFTKVSSFLDDIAKGNMQITEAVLHSKLISLGEHELAKTLKNSRLIRESLILECKSLRAEFVAGRFVLSHIDDGIKIIAKILSKVR